MAIFTTGTLIAVSVMAFHYMGLPNYLFGVGHYRVTLHLPAAAGLYSSGNVTYRGTEVGRVESVALTDTGVDAILSLEVRCRHPRRPGRRSAQPNRGRRTVRRLCGREAATVRRSRTVTSSP